MGQYGQALQDLGFGVSGLGFRGPYNEGPFRILVSWITWLA